MRQAFIESKNPNNRDLLDRLLPYVDDLEFQINGPRRLVCRIDAERRPTWDTSALFDRIGCSGRLWRQSKALFITFEIDVTDGHAKGVGIDPSRLPGIKEALASVPYVEVRESTSGKGGLHCYVWFDQPSAPTIKNRKQHTALSRAVFAKVCDDANSDTLQQPDVVDCIGGILWVHAKEPTENGFKLIKAATQTYPHSTENLNLDAVDATGKNRVVLPKGEQDIWAQLASAHPRTELDAQHKAHIDELATHATTIWNETEHLLQTHTVALAKAHRHLGLRGVYETTSPGSNLAQPNCFMFPGPNGTWKVYRFGNPTEAGTWTVAEKTWCYFNREISLPLATKLAGGFVKGKVCEFARGDKLTTMLATQYPETAIPAIPANQRCRIVRQDDGTHTIEVKATDPIAGFSEGAKRGWQEAALNIVGLPAPEPLVAPELALRVRCLATEDGSKAGWSMLNAEGDQWLKKDSSDVSPVLMSLDPGMSSDEATRIKGALTLAPWTIKSIPFQPEYPKGGRVWNDNAPQLKHTPMEHNDPEGMHPTWNRILHDLGKNLNDSVKAANMPHIRSGALYLQAWYACILRHPTISLPYLFMFGPQCSGKSTFSNAFKHLVTRGVTKAEKALQEKYNSELDGTVLAVVEEAHVTQAQLALMKDLVTSDTIAIRRMYTDVFEVTNYTHWVHYSNYQKDCPVFHGDKRTVVIRVDELESEINEVELHRRLVAEAPFFTHTLLTMPLPTGGRFAIPLLETEDKDALMDRHAGEALVWLREKSTKVKGSSMKIVELLAKMREEIPLVRRTEVLDACEAHGLVVRNDTKKTCYVEGIKI